MKKGWKTILLALFVISNSLVLPATAEETPGTADYKILGSIGGPTSAVAVSGNYVYVGKGTSVIVLENTGGSLHQAGRQLNLPSFVSDLKIGGKNLYAAAGSGGLHILDISNPLKPEEKGVYATRGFAEAVAVCGGRAYLANGIEGLQIIDVTNPSRPTDLGQAFKGKYAFAVAVSGNNAYIAAADDGLLTVDISEPMAPRELAALDTPGVARNVAVSGKYAYVADDWKGVSVIDISNPAAPSTAKTINTAGRAHGLALDKNFLYVADAYMGVRVFDIADIGVPKDLTSFIPASSQMIRVAVAGGYIYCVDRENGILCLEPGMPLELKLKGFYSSTMPIPLTGPADLDQNDFGYVYEKEIKRLMVLGIAETYTDGTLRLGDDLNRGELSIAICKVLKLEKAPAGSKNPFKDVPAGNKASGYAVAAVNQGLMKAKSPGFFDPEGKVSNEEAITLMLRLAGQGVQTADSYINAGDKFGLEMLLKGSLKQNITRGGFFILLYKALSEIPDEKTNMTLLQSKFGIICEAFPVVATQAAVKDGYAFVTSGTGVLSVVDVHDPSNPRLAAHINLPEKLTYIRIKGNYAYLPAINYLFTVDVSDPLHPVCICKTEIHANEPPQSMDLDQNRIYIVDEGLFKVFSIENPEKPLLLTQNYTAIHSGGDESGSYAAVAARNNIVHLLTQFEGIYVFDASDANNMKKLGWYKSSGGFAADIKFIGNNAYVNALSYVDIFDITDIGKPVSQSRLDNVASQNFVYKMDSFENLVLLPNDVNGLLLADVSKLGEAKPVSNVDTMGQPQGVTVDESRAYLADGVGGMSIISLSDAQSEIGGGGSGAAKPQTQIAALSFNNSLFKGLPAKRYVLSGEKAEAAVKNQRSTFTETLTVTNTKSTGEGSLSQCIWKIKEGGRILFDPKVFNPKKPATIYFSESIGLYDKGGITIDASNAGVILDGSRAPNLRGISINSDGNVVKGLKFQKFTGDPLAIAGSGNIIGGSRYKGSGPSGEGNVIVRSYSINIYSQNATDNIVVGNNIGVEADGRTPTGNTGGGIDLRGPTSRNTIGIDKPEYRNVISNCDGRGLSAMNMAYGNLFEGNYCGTDITGTIPEGNLYQHGIALELIAYGTIIRNNVTCDNGRAGILVGDACANFNVIIGNSSGIGADGITKLTNHVAPAIWCMGGKGDGSCYNVIGGKDPKLKNRLYSEHNELIGLEKGLYDTIVNGKVCKYMGLGRY